LVAVELQAVIKPGCRVELAGGQTGEVIKIIRSEIGPRWDKAVIRLDDEEGVLLPITPVVRFLAEMRVISPPARQRGL
jgi:hypothetical protein